MGANAAAAAAALGEPDAAEADGDAGSCAAGGGGAAAGTCAAGGLGRAAKGSACVCGAGNKRANHLIFDTLTAGGCKAGYSRVNRCEGA